MEKPSGPTVGLVVPVVDRTAAFKFKGTETLEAARKQLAREAFDAGVDMDTRETPSEAFEVWWTSRSKP